MSNEPLEFEIGKRYRVVDWDRFEDPCCENAPTEENPYFVPDSLNDLGNAQVDGDTIATLGELRNDIVELDEEEPDQFIVGATYEFIRNGPERPHYCYRAGDTFTVGRVDNVGDAFTTDGRHHCVTLRRLHNGSVRLVSNPRTSNPEGDTTMDLKEAYQNLQKAFLEANPVGTRVRILRGWSNQEANMYGTCRPGNANREDDAEIIHAGIDHIRLSNGYNYPCFVLEPISGQPVQVRLNREFTATINRDTIQVGCQTFPVNVIERLRAAHAKVMTGR